jgi:hypothetical protein
VLSAEPEIIRFGVAALSKHLGVSLSHDIESIASYESFLVTINWMAVMNVHVPWEWVMQGMIIEIDPPDGSPAS